MRCENATARRWDASLLPLLTKPDQVCPSRCVWGTDGRRNEQTFAHSFSFHPSVRSHALASLGPGRPRPELRLCLVVGDDVGTKSKRSARKLPDKEASLIMLDKAKVI